MLDRYALACLFFGVIIYIDDINGNLFYNSAKIISNSAASVLVNLYNCKRDFYFA